MEENMLTSREGLIFVSHAWELNKHYWMLIDWFLEKPYLSCKIPQYSRPPEKKSNELRKELTQQIAESQIIVVLSGMYAAHRTWMDYTIFEARRMNKPIIGVTSWRREPVPLNVEKVSTVPVVRWNKAGVVQAVVNVLEAIALLRGPAVRH
jgi:hypothetical protein